MSHTTYNSILLVILYTTTTAIPLSLTSLLPTTLLLTVILLFSVNINIHIHIHTNLPISTCDKYISIIFFFLYTTSHSPPHLFLRNHHPPLPHYIVRRNTASLSTLSQTILFVLFHHYDLYIHKPNTYPYISFNIHDNIDDIVEKGAALPISHL